MVEVGDLICLSMLIKCRACFDIKLPQWSWSNKHRECLYPLWIEVFMETIILRLLTGSLGVCVKISLICDEY